MAPPPKFDPNLSVHTLLDGSQPLGRRLAALNALQQHSRPPPAAVHAPPPVWLPHIMQQLLPLLLERQINIRNAACQALGSWTAHLAAAAGAGQVPLTHPALLFDWAEQKLGVKSNESGAATASPLPPPLQANILAALRTAVAGTPHNNKRGVFPALLSRALSVCLHMLEFPTCGAALVPALLQLLSMCIHGDQARRVGVGLTKRGQ